MATKKTMEAIESWSLVSLSGIVVYLAIDIVLAFLRTDYSLLHNAESDYGRGSYFWLMDINFILRCFLTLALVKAVLSAYPKNKAVGQASFWLIVWAIASGLLAFFTDNPYGYPKLGSGPIHLFLAFVAFIAVMIAMIMFSRLATIIKLGQMTSYLLIGLTALAIVAIVLLGHAGIRPHRLGGLYERIFLGAVLAWEAVLALAIRAKASAK